MDEVFWALQLDDSDCVYKKSTFKYLPRVGDKIQFKLPDKAFYEELEVEEVMFIETWECIVVTTEPVLWDEEVYDTLIADGWMTNEQLLSR